MLCSIGCRFDRLNTWWSYWSDQWPQRSILRGMDKLVLRPFHVPSVSRLSIEQDVKSHFIQQYRLSVDEVSLIYTAYDLE